MSDPPALDSCTRPSPTNSPQKPNPLDARAQDAVAAVHACSAIRQICDDHHRRPLNKLTCMLRDLESLGGFDDDQGRCRRRVFVRFDVWHSDRPERQ